MQHASGVSAQEERLQRAAEAARRLIQGDGGIQLLRVLRSDLEAVTSAQNGLSDDVGWLKSFEMLTEQERRQLLETLGQRLSTEPSSSLFACVSHLLSTSTDTVIQSSDGRALLLDVLAAFQFGSRSLRFSQKSLVILDLILSRHRIRHSQADVDAVLRQLRPFIIGQESSTLRRNSQVPTNNSEVWRKQARQPKKTSEDYASSSEDDNGGAKDQIDAQELAVKALQCLKSLALSHSRILFSFWNTWLICDPVENRRDVWSIAMGSLFLATRLKAIEAVIVMLSGASDVLRIADDRNTDTRQSFTALSVRIARVLRHLHSSLASQLRITALPDISRSLLKLAERLIVATPYPNLRPGLLSGVYEGVLDVAKRAISPEMTLLTLKCLKVMVQRKASTQTVENFAPILPLLDDCLASSKDASVRDQVWELASLIKGEDCSRLIRIAQEGFLQAVESEQIARLRFLSSQSTTMFGRSEENDALLTVLTFVQNVASTQIRLAGAALSVQACLFGYWEFITASLEDSDYLVRIATLKALSGSIFSNCDVATKAKAIYLVCAAPVPNPKTAGAVLDAMINLAESLRDDAALHTALTKCFNMQTFQGLQSEQCRAIGVLVSNMQEIVDIDTAVEYLCDTLSALDSPKAKWNAAQAVSTIVFAQQEWLHLTMYNRLQSALSANLETSNFKLLQKVATGLAAFDTCDVKLATDIIQKLKGAIQRVEIVDISTLSFQQAQLLPVLKEKIQQCIEKYTVFAIGVS